jgi:tetratricopeptide (TPR) repeat protein
MRGVGRWLVPALVVLVTAIAFLPALRNQFVSWDDLYMFPENPHYRGLGWTQLAWMWTTFHIYEFMPFTWMTYGADYLVWGLDPFGYHLTNLLLHVTTTVAVYGLVAHLLRLGAWSARTLQGNSVPLAAGLATLLFAVHPLRAEPVAWVSARGSILGGLFLVLTTLAYLRACHGARLRRGWYAGAVGLFALALLSRSTSVMLPVVLATLDVYPLRRLGGGPGRWFGCAVRHVWLEKVPYVVLALPVLPLALGARFQGKPAVMPSLDDLFAGIAVAGHGLAFYLKKTLLLGAFSPLYERPPQLSPWQWRFIASAAAVLAISVALVALRRRWPAGLAAWVSYIAILLPTLGILRFGLQMAADRYTYVAGLGWAILVGAGALTWHEARCHRAIGRPAWAASLVLALGVIAGLGAVTWSQVQVWRDSKTLWTHVATVQPQSAVAQLSLGQLFEEEGDLARATEHYRRAVAAWPQDERVHTNLGRILVRQGRLDEALPYFERAVGLRPTSETHLRLGRTLVARGRLADGIAHYHEALRFRPDSPGIHYTLGLALAAAGRLAEAVEHYRTALRLEPGFEEAKAELGGALGQLDGTAGARGR